jgi:hypothetical protein
MPEPKFTATFVIHETGEDTEEKFDGTFKIRTKLSFKEQLLRDELRRQYLGVTPAGTDAWVRAASLADLFSELGVRIIDAPVWWKSADNGMNLYDDNVAKAVYETAMAEVNKSSKKTAADGEKAKSDVMAAAPKE